MEMTIKMDTLHWQCLIRLPGQPDFSVCVQRIVVSKCQLRSSQTAGYLPSWLLTEATSSESESVEKWNKTNKFLRELLTISGEIELAIGMKISSYERYWQDLSSRRAGVVLASISTWHWCTSQKTLFEMDYSRLVLALVFLKYQGRQSLSGVS